jgi:hypothetical protein
MEVSLQCGAYAEGPNAEIQYVVFMYIYFLHDFLYSITGPGAGCLETFNVFKSIQADNGIFAENKVTAAFFHTCIFQIRNSLSTP